jgi:unsaturated chondroitin disaccharide hydrolase
MYTVNGKWKHTGELWTHWCDGFLPGMMWIFYENTADATWRKLAEKYSRALEDRKNDRTVHDLGFIFYHGTYRRWFDLTAAEGRPDRTLQKVVIHAGQVLAKRFRPAGEYLRSFVAEDSLFIDIMMNVPVIFYAAQHTGDAELFELAMRHCYTTRRTLLRGDGSTSHEGVFDLNTGEFLKQTTHQGFRGDSCWSRGLAWSLYGFATCYKHTRDPAFLAASEANAAFYIQNTPDGGVPPWDYDAPDSGKLSRKQPDSSAAAIAACGLFELAMLTNDTAKSYLYSSYAHEIVETLCTKAYLAAGTRGWEGILKRGVYHIHKGLGVDESVMWGEYFFVEALGRVLQGQ